MDEFTSIFDSSISWEDFIARVRHRSCLAQAVCDLPHPAAPLLATFKQTGAPANFQRPWSLRQKDKAVATNGYASTRNYQGFLETELVDMIQKGYWIVLPYNKIRQQTELRLSQAGIIPQADRRPRTIVDYRRSGVNDDTITQAPADAMQFGRALERGLYAIHTADDNKGPVYMMKNDLADGFYRIQIDPAGSLALAMVVPVPPGAEPLIAVPLTLPMGWTESPPYFCALTETIVDLANQYTTPQWRPERHPLEELATTPPGDLPQNRQIHQHTSLAATEAPSSEVGTTKHIDVFVDDMLVFAQGCHQTLDLLRRQLFHLTDAVLRPNDDEDQHRREPISTSKLQKGDGCWTTYKKMLGWMVDSIRKTIELPGQRRQRLLTILDDTRKRKRISVNKCQKLLGELRSMLLAISGGDGFFSQLQFELTHAKNKRVRITRAVRDHLDDLYRLATDIANRPTRIAELFPTNPGHIFGTCDASGAGMGGIFFAEDGQGYACAKNFQRTSRKLWLPGTTQTGLYPIPI